VGGEQRKKKKKKIHCSCHKRKSFEPETRRRKISILLPFQKSLDFLVETESRCSVVFHVKLVLVGEMLINASLSKHRIHAMMVAEENIAELLLAVELFVLLRQRFFAVFVHKAGDEFRQTVIPSLSPLTD
jgi:hypothetical protein